MLFYQRILHLKHFDRKSAKYWRGKIHFDEKWAKWLIFGIFALIIPKHKNERNQTRDAAGHYPTRATRPVTRPVLNRPNYPYYP